MALIMYFTKAPRCQNMFTRKYESIPVEDLILVNKYYNWKKAQYEAKYENGKYYASSLEEWCGVPESELPDMYTVNYYCDHYVNKKVWSEYSGERTQESIFEHAGRIAKANQIFRWFIENVMDNTIDMNLHEVSKEHFEKLLAVCNEIMAGSELHTDIAEEKLPLLENKGLFFGTNEYGEFYKDTIIETTDIINKILETTDFEKETVYFNAIW